MSAVVGEPVAGGSQKYVNFDEYVEFQVNKTRAGIRYTDLLLAVVTVLLVVAGYLLLFVVADQWLIEGGFGDWTRTGLLAAVVGFIGFWTTWKIVLPYWKRVTALYAAKELEGTQPQLKSSLLTLVDLKQAGRNVSPHILTAMEKRAALQLSQIDVEQAVDRRPLMRLAYTLLGVVVALCLYTVLSPKPVGASLLRALIPIADIGVATRTQIVKVEPGATSILARSRLEVTVDVKGEIPPEATLLYTTHDRSLVDEAVVLRDTGEGLNRFRGTLSGPNGRGLLQDFTYRVVAGDAESESFPVSVRQAPYATVDSVTYVYPSYMGLDPQTQSGGDVEAWEGTKVTLRGATNMPVVGATLRFHDTEDTSVKAEELPLRLVDSTHFELTWTLQFRRDGTFARFYQIDLRTEEGQRDPVPRLYNQSIRRDLPPEIKLLHPSGDLEVPANAVLPLAFTARDPDFLLRSIRLRFEQRETPIESRTRHLFDAPPYQAEVHGQGEIKLSDFTDLKSGDVLTFYLEAWDNMAPLDREGNRSVTPKINLRIIDNVSAEEVEQQRAEQARVAQQQLEEVQSSQTAEHNDAEPPSEDPVRDDQAAASNTDQGQPAESEDSGEQNATEQQPGEPTTGAGQPANQQNAEPSETQKQENAQQQAQQGEQTPEGSQQQNADGGKSGQQSKAGNAKPSPSGTGQQQKSATDQSGSQPGAQQQGSQSQPGAQASDDEALAKLLNKYKDEIKQQREQEQQEQQDDSSDAKLQQGNNAQQGSQSSASKPQQKSSGDQGSENSNSETGESNKTGDESTSSSETSRSRSEGTKPDDANKGEQQNQAGDDGKQSGDPAQSPNPESQPKQPGEQPQPGEKPQAPGSHRDPRESQDPRAPEQPKSANGEQQQGKGEQSQPMTGESDSSQSTSPSGQQSRGSGTPSEDPSAEKPANESGSKPDGDAGRPSNDDAQPTDDPEQSGANDPNASKTSKTGDQPKGANEQNPGEGRKDGQRSDQPQTGEKGSSQQTSEGQESNQSGAGEASESQGSQSEGANGQSSPGEGKQAGDKPGQPKSGSGSKSQPGQSGSEASESGDPQQSGSEGSEGSEGAEQKTGSKAQAGETPGSKPESRKPENKGNGQQGRSEESPSGDKKPGESGAQGEKPSGEGEKSGNEQSGSGGGEKPQGQEAGKKPSDSGGGKKPGSKPQGDKPEGGGEQGSESKGSGEQQGSDSGGSKSSGSESGSESGGGQSGAGEPGESSSSSSSTPGNSPQTGKPGSGQSSGGRVGAGGRGTNEGPAPQGSGGVDSTEAGPSEPADLRDRKKATELVLQKLQDEVSRGEVSPELLQDLGWSEQNLREFMDRLDRRLSDTGEDESPEATARRRQFDEILRGIHYESEGLQKSADGGDRPVNAGAGPIPRLPAPSEFRRAEESMRQKLSRETKSKK